MNDDKKLKPIVFVQGDRQYYRQNNYAQNLILKALFEGITDVNELRKLTGMKSAADVYRTLDKLAIRKEYHEALSAGGIDLDYIVNGIKGICDKGQSDSVRLKGYQTLLRSLGLDKYEKMEDTGKSWEETLLKLTDDVQEEQKIIDEIGEYEVIAPPVPDSAKKRQKKEKEAAKSLYED